MRWPGCRHRQTVDPKRDLAELLEWAESYRGPRAIAASAVSELLGTASAWLRERVAELETRRAAIAEMGGEERIARQHGRGKLTADRKSVV